MQTPAHKRSFAVRGLALAIASLALSACGTDRAAAGAAGAVSEASPAAPAQPTPVQGAFAWKPLRVGAGGFVTGIDIAPDGTKVVRADSAGAFIWSDAKGEWVPLLTYATMPKGEWGFEVSAITGVFEVAIAPSNSSRIYVVYNGSVFRTDDKGKSFVKTSLTGIPAAPNDDFRTFGRKMAVDPVNPDVVVVGSQTRGLYLSSNAGQNWSQIGTVPSSTTANGLRVCYDTSSPVRNGRTSRLYVGAQDGVYVSQDAGQTFSLSAGSPGTLQHLSCAKNGMVWATDTAGKVYRLSSGSWSLAGPTDAPFKTIAIDPVNPSHVVIATPGGSIAQTFNSGGTWTGIYNMNMPANSGRRVATDIPWLAVTNENYMSSGDMAFDPSAGNKLFFAEGVGVWWSNPPATFVGFDWNSQSKGIEQLVSNQFLSIPGGNLLYLAWDRPIFQITDPDEFPTGHGPNYKSAIVMGWSADYVPTNPKMVVGMFNWWGLEESGYSTDGGATWIKFASVPADVSAGKISGAIAAGSADNFVWVPSNNASPWYTTDRGKTWSRSSIPGVPTTGETGWGWAYYMHRSIITADKVAANTFYAYNYVGTSAGLYKSTDGGASFERIYTGAIAAASSYHAKLASVPGQQGNLFFTSGSQDGPNPGATNFMRSKDGGKTWTAVGGMQEVVAFGFGAHAPSQTYPAIYVAGYYNGKYGIWRSDDDAQSWTNLGDYPLDMADEITTVSGDANIYGRVYVGFGGSGAIYGGFNNAIAASGSTTG